MPTNLKDYEYLEGNPRPLIIDDATHVWENQKEENMPNKRKKPDPNNRRIRTGKWDAHAVYDGSSLVVTLSRPACDAWGCYSFRDPDGWHRASRAAIRQSISEYAKALGAQSITIMGKEQTSSKSMLVETMEASTCP